MEPHSGIASQKKHGSTLDLTARSSGGNRKLSVDLVANSFGSLERDLKILRWHSSELSQMVAVQSEGDELVVAELAGRKFHYHRVVTEDFSSRPYLRKILAKLCDARPSDYETLLKTPGVGPKTIRALSLVAEVIYGAKPSYEDPARYSFAHGGKDATPYPVDRSTYDNTIETLRNVVKKTTPKLSEKSKMLQRLATA